MRIAVTGATGFVGRHLVHALAARHEVRALVRRRDPALSELGVELVAGALEDGDALGRLVAGAEVVVHAAALIRAPSAAEFDRVNHRGTEHLVRAAARAGVRRFVLVSSLAARAPAVSAYARSKAAAETALKEAGGQLETVVVRPPAVYGPGDRATLEIFRGIARGRLILPANARGRFSLLYVEDLAALVAELVTAPLPAGLLVEPDDGTENGYDWPGLAAIASAAAGRPVKLHLLPRSAAGLLAGASELLARFTGGEAVLPRDKLGELFYPDWVCRARPDPALLSWRPAVGFAEGVRRTLEWYRAAGWLPRAETARGPTLGEPSA